VEVDRGEARGSVEHGAFVPDALVGQIERAPEGSDGDCEGCCEDA
jgi:hypothetical protein